MSKELKVTVVAPEDIEVWSEEEQRFVMNTPATFYVQDALGQLNFIHTKDREEARKWANETFGEGKYNVKAAKEVKNKSRLESGNLSCYGTATRKGQKKHS